MPYIDKTFREELQERPPENAGELTFLLTQIIDNYVTNNVKRFSTYAEIIGALEATKLELYRRKIGPYEDHKMLLSGDVYNN